MSKQIKNIFSDTACPSQELMLKYASNLLKGEEKHGFERHLAGCAFCSDALEGLSLYEKTGVLEDISLLHRKIDSISKLERKTGYWSLAMAASVSILLVIGTWFYLKEEKKETVAIKTEGKKNEILLHKAPGPGSVLNNAIEEDSVKEQIAVQNYKEEEEKSKGSTEFIPPIILENDKVMKENNETPRSSLKQDVEEHYNKIGTSVAAGAMSPIPAPALPSLGNNVQAKKAPEDNISENMLAMVENEIINNPSQIPARAGAEKKSKSRLQAPSSKQEASKDKSLDDCPNCPEKSLSEAAQSNLVVLSLDYALKKYQMKEYELAHKQFEEIIKEDDDPAQTKNAKIFNALSLVKLNRGGEALDIVNNIISGSSGQTMDVAKWIKASILISMKENVKAKVILEDLSSHVNPYQARAKEVLANLSIIK